MSRSTAIKHYQDALNHETERTRLLTAQDAPRDAIAASQARWDAARAVLESIAAYDALFTSGAAS